MHRLGIMKTALQLSSPLPLEAELLHLSFNIFWIKWMVSGEKVLLIHSNGLPSRVASLLLNHTLSGLLSCSLLEKEVQTPR